MIKAGRVTVDGRVVRNPAQFIDPAVAQVRLDGHPLPLPSGYVYLVLHKPVGYVVTRCDPRGRRTVMDLLGSEMSQLVYPVGRLDRDVSGLLLLTNDGELAYRLTHPSYHLPRTYEVEVVGEVKVEALRRLAEGVELEDGPTAPARVKVHRRSSRTTLLKLTLYEGRKNQVKRMCAAVGHPVRSLRRVGFGSLHLGHMPVGSWRRLRPAEIVALQEAVGLRSRSIDVDSEAKATSRQQQRQDTPPRIVAEKAKRGT
ncbi:MAG: pseudouridine synthase [Candidatus Zipacnadales bacterium]